MKPQQGLSQGTAGRLLRRGSCRVQVALPTLTALTIAIASTIVLALAGCASSAPAAQMIAPGRVGLAQTETAPLATLPVAQLGASGAQPRTISPRTD